MDFIFYFLVSHHKEPGIKPLHYACKYNCIEIVKLLVEHGANVNSYGYSVQEDIFSFPLSMACEYNNQDIVKYLIENGAEINPQIPEEYKEYQKSYNVYPLEGAIKGSLDLVKILVESCDKLDLSKALSFAIQNNKYEVMEYLLSKGAELNLTESEIQKLFERAVTNCDHRIIQFLIEKGASIEKLDDIQRSFLSLIRKGNLEAVKLFVEKGVNPQFDTEFCAQMNTITSFISKLVKRFTPLHRACNVDDYEIVKFLIDCGCNKDALDSQNHKPAYYTSDDRIKELLQ